MNWDDFDKLIASINRQLPPTESSDSIPSGLGSDMLTFDESYKLNSPLPQPNTSENDSGDTP